MTEQEQSISDRIRATPPLDRLSGPSVALLASAGEWRTLAPGETLFAFGDDGDAMYVVADGRVEASIPGKAGESIVVAELGPNSIVGEIQLLTGGKRTANVRAVTATRLVGFKRAAFDRLAETEPGALAEINSMILRRLRDNQLSAALTAYFGVIPREALQEIERVGEWIRLGQGDALFHHGDPGDSVFVLVSGSLGVLAPSDGGDTLVARIEAGGLIGEISLITDEPRSATVYAIRESELVRFSNRAFFPLLERYPTLLLQIARLNVKRLKETMGSAAHAPAATIVSLLPVPGTSIADFARELRDALAVHGSVLHLNSANIEDTLEMPGIAQAPETGALSTRFSGWLSEQEIRHRFILLETDDTNSNWTKRCLRGSDQVITVAPADSDPALGPVESTLYPGQQLGTTPKRLVLVHPADTVQPTGTARWLARRQLEMHHHVREGNRGDMQRLARFLSGTAVCLALGGGGARGFAHIGAYRALREADTPIDFIGGTSMGAVIGAEMALGVPASDMVELNRRLFRNSGLLMDLTLPMLSFTTGRAYAASLQEMFGEIAMEDLWIPYLCVSSNISRATMAVHRTGSLRHKVRASSGVQGLFPPVVIDGDLHVDGALFSNLPADVMKSVCKGVVLAVDVTPPVDLSEYSDYGDTISGWQVLWNRLADHDHRLQSADIGTVMQRSAEAASMANQRRVIKTMTDFYLQMPVQQIKLLEFGAIARLAEIGYATAKRKIGEWKADARWVQS